MSLTTIPYSGATTPQLTATECELLAFILPLSNDYPDIKTWFLQKVIPGQHIKTRRIMQIRRDGKIVAMGIAKNTVREKKICTVRVSPEVIGRGYGIRILEELMDWLGTDKPLVTVSEQRLDSFKRIFRHYDYRLTSVSTGIYIPGRSEYMFNEPNSPLTWGMKYK